MTTATAQHTNRLTEQTSPYLLQHAHNPVDWWPWSQEALDRAREENKLILLSIGYSACHWCHVMAHESFEDEETAEVMNELYINIKVDREERPDLDKIYQTAHQLLNQRGGGWPLTVVLTPDDRVPFFAGTYFPGTPKHGMPAFKDILKRIDEFYREHRDDIKKQNASMVNALHEISTTETSDAGALDSTPMDQARQQLEENFDQRYAGFGQAPKFPHPTNLDRLLRHWAATAERGEPDQRALDMARLTLHAMACGGIYDQLGGGFYRYSVDDDWMIPHFEKMLYDNGPLLSLNAEAYAATNEAVFKRVAIETGEWVMREMQSPQGGYYSTLDADAEGEEGRFYVWTAQEVKEHLTEDQYAVFAPVFGLDRSANFEGRWHLHMFNRPAEVGKAQGHDPDATEELLHQARQRLFAQRGKRTRPGRDEKILTAWNGLMIKGMADAGRRLDRGDFIASAQKAVDFIHDKLFQDGRLLATYKDGKAHLNAYLDDYVLLAEGLLALLQAHWRERDLHFARQLMDVVLSHFEDPEQGGLFFTSSDHEELIQRPKTLMDESIPAGNGVAAVVLGRLGHLLGETRYLDAAQRTLQAAWRSITRVPYVHATLLNALEDHLYPPQTVVLRGQPGELSEWLAPCREQYAPRRMCFAIASDAADLPGLLAERKPAESGPIAYVCSGMQCQSPTTDKETYLSQLQGH